MRFSWRDSAATVEAASCRFLDTLARILGLDRVAIANVRIVLECGDSSPLSTRMRQAADGHCCCAAAESGDESPHSKRRT
jgi:hypothetical protein